MGRKSAETALIHVSINTLLYEAKTWCKDKILSDGFLTKVQCTSFTLWVTAVSGLGASGLFSLAYFSVTLKRNSGDKGAKTNWIQSKDERFGLPKDHDWFFNRRQKI